MAQETAEQSLDERLTVLKELQQKNSLSSESAELSQRAGTSCFPVHKALLDWCTVQLT